LEAKKDWVRDVAWCPNIGVPYDILVSCHEENTVCFWKNQGSKNSKFELLSSEVCDGPAWRASWNFSGTLVAVSCVHNNSDNCVKIFRVSRN